MRFSSLAAASLWLLFCFGSGLARAQDGAVILDEIVAKVNNEIITLTDLKKELRFLRNGLEEQIRDPEQLEREFQSRKRILLKNVIRNKLLVQMGEELGLTANIDADVNQYLEQFRRDAGIPSLEVLNQYLQQRGSSLAEYRETIKQQMIVDSVIRQRVYSKITLLTPEIEAFYRENLEKFTEPAEVDLAEILFLTEGKDATQVRRRAEEALAKLREGTPFEELARQYSDGPTAARGGTIGTFRKGSMDPALEEAVFQLEVGEHTGILKTEYGFQILKVTAKRPPRQKPLEEVRPQIQEFLYQKKAQPELKAFLEELLQQSYVYVNPKYREEYDVEDFTS